MKLSEILDKYDNQPFCDEVNTILEKMKDEKRKNLNTSCQKIKH